MMSFAQLLSTKLAASMSIFIGPLTISPAQFPFVFFPNINGQESKVTLLIVPVPDENPSTEIVLSQTLFLRIKQSSVA